MNPIPVPSEALAGRPDCEHVQMHPPLGVSDEDCGTAPMLLAPWSTAKPGIGRGHYAYFRPDADDLAKLNAGGFIEFAQYGESVHPFSAVVWPAATDAVHAVHPANGEVR